MMLKLSSPSMQPFPKCQLGADVTVAMSTYGNVAVTRNALEALFLAAEGDFELLLIDNHSPDGAVRELLREASREHPNTTLFFFRENREYSGALNAILSHASGRWVLFLSNDIFVTPDYLREILAVARADERHGIVRGCSNFVDNGKATHNLNLTRPLGNFQELFAIGKAVAEQAPGQYLIDDFLTGDAFLISRAVLEKIGTIDTRYFGYFADHDLGVRAQIAGFELVLARGAFAFHQNGANFDYLPAAERERKVAERWARVNRGWETFKASHRLPAELPYTSILAVPWRAMAAVPFDAGKHFIPPGDYSAERAPKAG